MSALVQGKIFDTNLSLNSKGGTEQMRDRLLRSADPELINKVTIHLSRVRSENRLSGIPNILWCHDLAHDPESEILANTGYNQFDKIVFVSYWQRDRFVDTYNIPLWLCTVIENAIERQQIQPTDRVPTKFIYHTTPHRGLELLYPVFNAISKHYQDLTLDVYSSFGVYGWHDRDKRYQPLFDQLINHPKIKYHGAQPNSVVMDALLDSDVFLYPSIWHETSCIAMIEAIQSKVVVIHPSLAALPETASERTIMYDFTEDRQQHMQRAYATTKAFLDGSIKCPPITDIERNSISVFTQKWNRLLDELTTKQH